MRSLAEMQLIVDPMAPIEAPVTGLVAAESVSRPFPREPVARPWRYTLKIPRVLHPLVWVVLFGVYFFMFGSLWARFNPTDSSSNGLVAVLMLAFASSFGTLGVLYGLVRLAAFWGIRVIV